MKTIIYCKNCLMPNSRPRIEFDQNGVCNACRNAEQKNMIDWTARKAEFLQLVDHYRSRNGSYDCVVPWSGGKDSSAIAWRLKFEFGLNPLLVTFSPLIPNEVGAHNREEMLRAGFDHLMVRPNQHVARHLARRFFRERGNPKVHWDAGVNAVPVQVAVSYNIPLVFYAEHGESEYGGRVLSEEHRKIRDLTEVLEHQIGDDPHNWVDQEVSEKDLLPYLYPAPEKAAAIGLKALYFAYFFRWSMFENYNYVREKIEFHVAPHGRTDGTFTNFDSLDDKIDDIYYYLQFIKFGFGRANRDACRMINNDHMSRAEGLALTMKYDGEFPATYFGEALEYLGITADEFTHIVDMHRNNEIWTMEGNQWKLRNPVK
ncbi:MAG TPA: N-acetyl sugar amidotransferase [Candidatus Acidoferrales bacterium]|nr:N-acetyl sugar amidotransferase [Candidatus Acidoferrales bacterium]